MRWALLGVVIVGLGLALVGASLTWGTVTIDGQEAVTDTGLTGGDGYVTLVAALVAAAAAAFTAGLGSRIYVAVTAPVAGLVVLGVFLSDYRDVLDQPAEIAGLALAGTNPRVEAVVGAGLWLTLASAIVLIAAGVLAALPLRRR